MIKRIVVLMILSILIMGCSEERIIEKVKYNNISDVPVSAWEKLSKRKIYFGHQSVGNNIIDGIIAVKKEFPEIKIDIVETHNSNELKNGTFAHSRIGKNGKPKSKIGNFVNILNDGMGNKADIALFKFCYVDVVMDTDINSLFIEYKEAMSKFSKDYPTKTFIHVTTPLFLYKPTWKTWLKELFNKKEIFEYDNNVKRNQFNDLLVKEYGGKGILFDLAKTESTLADGTRSTFERNGKMYYSLAKEYTDDGGHLNKAGQKIVAKKLLLMLVNL